MLESPRNPIVGYAKPWRPTGSVITATVYDDQGYPP
jgi:hypothetical protein